MMDEKQALIDAMIRSGEINRPEKTDLPPYRRPTDEEIAAVFSGVGVTTFRKEGPTFFEIDKD